MHPSHPDEGDHFFTTIQERVFLIIKVFSLESFAVSMDKNHVTNDCLHENVSLLEETIESAEAAENEIQRIA